MLSFQLGTAQDLLPKVSLSLENSNLKEVINNIEDVTDCRFFYLDKWLDDITVSGNYVDVSLNVVLKDILKETVINFHIMPNHRIVLTYNNIIYDKLPEDFFEKNNIEDSEIDEESIGPVFYNATPLDTMQTIRIGKQSANTLKRSFILSGFAKNAKTRNPIVELNVVVKGKNLGAVTDINGFYTIKIPLGVNIIETRSMGFVNSIKKVIMYDNGKLDFNLEEGIETLDEVIIDANAAKNVEQVISGVSKIEIAKIKNIPLVLGERDILKVATMLPGVTKAGEGAAGYNVRGGKADQNLILLDNALIYNPLHFFGVFSALNPFTTSTVNIYKGSIPVEYGGRLSSVFDINTKDGNVDKFSGEASIGPVTSNLTLEVPIIKGKSSALVGIRNTYSKWILKSLKEEALKNSKASFYDIITKYNHKLNDNNYVSATAYYSKDVFNVSSDSLFSYSNSLFSLKWSHKINKKNSADLMLSNSQYRYNIKYDNNSLNDFDQGYRINETELKLKMKYLYGKAHKFNYGFSSKLYNVNPGSLKPLGNESNVNPITIRKERGVESALFVSDDYKLNEKFSMYIGFRYSLFAAIGESLQRVYEKNEPKSESTVIEVKKFNKNEIIKTYGGLEARLSGRYFLSPNFSMKASYNNTLQYIHALSNNTTASPTDIWKLSDLNTVPQRADMISLGLYQNSNDNIFEFSVESYYKRLNNIIDYKVGAELFLNETIETEVFQGIGKSYGIEFLVKKNKGKLNGWLGYTYSRSFIKFDSEFRGEKINNGKYFPANFDKPHDISLVANYRLSKRYSLSTNFIYQTGRPVTFPIGTYTYRGTEYVLYSDRNQFRIPDYYRLDLSFNIEGKP